MDDKKAHDRPACGACGGPMAPFLATRDYNRRVSDTVFHYYRCGSCGLVSLMNVPADLGPYYAADYHALPASAAVIERAVRHDRYKIELVRRYVSGGRLLEIGPSWGAFCLLAKRAGFEVEAIEMDPRCCEFLETRIGVRAINSVDAAASLVRAGVPDVIAMWHVIEHLREPWTLLARLAERLAPGGIMVLATPNTEAVQFGIFGRRWTHVDAPRHVHLIPPALLRRKLGEYGLRELLTTTRDAGSIGWNSFGWSFSAAGFTRCVALKRLLRLAGHIPALIFAPIERAEGKGSAYTVVFQKPPLQS
jgi:2-polyprenyl-3-methyl-5-hydroxy-6-metoxy-1,4-benzoquinol methylase